MALTVKPLGYRVVVEKVENRKMGNIEVPDSAKGVGFNRFKVVALGDPKILPTGERIPIPVKIDDELLFNVARACECGPPYIFGDRELSTVDVDGILAVFSGEPDLPVPKIVKARNIPQLVH